MAASGTTGWRLAGRATAAAWAGFLLLGMVAAAGARAPKANNARGPAQFVDTWSNPNAPIGIVIRGDGQCAEVRRDGSVRTTGRWVVSAPGAGSLQFAAARRSYQMWLCGNDILVLQPYLPDGGSDGDGMVFFRKDFDFEGKNVKPGLANAKARGLVVGTWSHPNSQLTFDVAEGGSWTESRKNGGAATQAVWSYCDDQSFQVDYEGGRKLRLWPVPQGGLAILQFEGATGQLVGDGQFVTRVK